VLLTRAPTSALDTLSLHDALPISSTAAAISARRSAHECPATLADCSRRRSGESSAINRSSAATAASASSAIVTPSTPSRAGSGRSEEHTSELQSRRDLVCRLLLEK